MSAEVRTACASVDAELDRQFGASNPALSAQARRHLTECARCRELYRYLSAPSPSIAVSNELSARIEQTLKSSLKPVKPAASIAIRATQFFLLFVLLTVPLASMMNGVGWRLMNRGELLGVTIVLAGGAVLLSLSLAWQMTPGSLQRIPATGAMLILGASFLVVVALLFPWHTPQDFFRLGWRCMKMGLMMAAPGAVLFGFLVWRGAPFGIGTLGATLGAISGLLGAAALQYNCDTQDAIHLIVWHGGSVLALSTLMGYLMGRAVEGLRR